MFSSVESCRTNRAHNRLVASSIMAIRYNFSPRPSSQSCSLVSHCTNSPNRLRRGRQVWTCLTFSFFPRHSLARIIHCRTVSLLTSRPCLLSKYSAANVGPNPSYTDADKICPACRSTFSSIRRFEARPRSPWTTALSPRCFIPSSSRCTCRMLRSNSSAASRWVIRFFFAFFKATSRSLSACVISSCPSCIPQAWGCQDDISTLLKGDIITLPPHVGSTALTRRSGSVNIACSEERKQRQDERAAPRRELLKTVSAASFTGVLTAGGAEGDPPDAEESNATALAG